MFAVEFIQTHLLRGGEVDAEDIPWTRMIVEHETEEAARSEVAWLEMACDGYTYRVRDLATEVAA